MAKAKQKNEFTYTLQNPELTYQIENIQTLN